MIFLNNPWKGHDFCAEFYYNLFSHLVNTQQNTELIRELNTKKRSFPPARVKDAKVRAVKAIPRSVIYR